MFEETFEVMQKVEALSSLVLSRLGGTGVMALLGNFPFLMHQNEFDRMSSETSFEFEEIKRNIIARDIADENRDISPLRRADDAIVLDNSRMTVKEQMIWVMSIIDKHRNGS